MKNVLLIVALASFAAAGAIQKEQPKKATTKKTNTAAKKSPTPTKKSTTTAKKTPTPSKAGDKSKKAGNTAKKETKKTSPSTANKAPSNQKTTAAKVDPKKKATAAIEKPKARPATTPKRDDKGDLEKALMIEAAEKKLTALAKFLTDYPKSSLRSQALESLTAVRFVVGEAKLDDGDREKGLKLILSALHDAPVPYPKKLFVETISRIPSSLYARGEHAAALESASAIEKNSASSAPQLLALAGFYLSTENGNEVKRLAEAAIKLEENSAAAYQMLGMAHRLNFDLEASSSAFAKALELDSESLSGRRNLADMKRAIGKSEEALALYSEVLTKDPDDLPSQTGRILSLFEGGKRSEAESELLKSIEANAGNVVLLAGAAWWYASHGETAKAIDLAGKGIASEPRYIWSHIALARAFASDGRFADAEQALLKAKKYGNFATLEYELASVRFASGFYREAAEELQKSFVVNDGLVSTKLGRRIERSEKTLPELIATERRASILMSSAGDDTDNADRMKTLLEFTSVLSGTSPDATRATELAQAFSKGDDRMRFYRQIFAANSLLEKRIAPATAFKLAREAVSGVDDGLSIASPSAPIMSSELYANRVSAIAADRYVIVPDVPKQTLSAIARGRIEEVAGWSLLEQGNHAEAVTRLRRAVSILPDKSAWWRSSHWRLGTALAGDGKDKEALEAYVKAYTASEPDASKYAVIETVFKRLNGGTEGLEALIGADPSKPVEKVANIPSPVPPETKKESSSVPADEKPSPKVEISPDLVKTDDKTTIAKKPESATDAIPTSIPVETAKKPDATTPKQKPVEITVAPSPINKIEEKRTDSTTPPDDSAKNINAPPIETPKKADDVPMEKKDGFPPVVKPAEKEADPKTASENASTPPTSNSSEVPKKTEAAPVGEKQPEREVPPLRKVEESKRPLESEAQKPLFEPVVIEVKNSTKPKKSTDVASDTERKPVRDRVVEGKETVSKAAPPPCTITVSQEDLSLIADGGSIGVLVGIDGEVDLKQLTAAASTPKDIEVSRQPEIAGVSSRAFYVIKSLSNAAGDHKVTFSAPCGKKDVSVKVR